MKFVIIDETKKNITFVVFKRRHYIGFTSHYAIVITYRCIAA